MSIRNFFRKLRRRETNNAMGILGSLGCFNIKPNGITPSLCNEGMIKEIIRNEKKQGHMQTVEGLKSWLKANRRRLN